MNPHRPPAAAKAESARLTALIVLLRDTRGLSYDQISAKLACDHGIHISRAAVWQRYKRGTKP